MSEELKLVSNSALHGELKSLRQTEKTNLKDILLHICEVDRRRLYLQMAYPSLYEYLIKELQYSEASAQRRVDGARLLAQIPEAAAKISSGAINLSQISKIQKASRDVKKVQGLTVSIENKKELMDKIENQSGRVTELILAQTFNLPVQFNETRKIQKDESVHFEMTFTKQQMENLEQARALLSHILPGGKMSEVISHLAKRFIEKKFGRTCATEDIRKTQNELRH